MIKAGSCLKHVFGEEIVFAIDYLIVLQVKDFLREMFALTIAIENKRGHIEGHSEQPLLG